MANLKQYIYTKGHDPALDEDFNGSSVYGKVKSGQTALFWKSGLRWYAMPLNNVQRIFRRVETVYGKLCCGGHTFVIEWLVLILNDGSEVVVHIGDDVKTKAEALLQSLKDVHPEIAYGKV